MIVTKNSNDHEICTQIPKKYPVTTNFGANGKKNRRDKVSEGSNLCRDSIFIRVVTDLEFWVEPIHYCIFILLRKKIPKSILLVCSKCKKE